MRDRLWQEIFLGRSCVCPDRASISNFFSMAPKESPAKGEALVQHAPELPSLREQEEWTDSQMPDSPVSASQTLDLGDEGTLLNETFGLTMWDDKGAVESMSQSTLNEATLNELFSGIVGPQMAAQLAQEYLAAQAQQSSSAAQAQQSSSAGAGSSQAEPNLSTPKKANKKHKK